MKKLLFSALFAITSIAQAAPWDLNGQQYDQFGTSMINRLMPLPAGGANGIYVYSASLNLPKLATYDSTLTLSGLVLGINPTTLAGKFDTPTGNAGQYLAGDGSLVTFPTAVSFFSNDAAYVNQAGARSAVSLTTTGSGAATYNNTTGVINIPTPVAPVAQVNADWNSVSGVSQILNKPTIPTIPTNVSAFTNDSGYITQAGARSAVSLTTTGTSGAATYNSGTGVLNIPNYAPGTGTVTSVTAGTGLSGGTFTTSGTISMPATGTVGTYSSVTTDAQGRVTAGTNASQSAQTRTLNSAFQVSATRPSLVTYSIRITTTASIGGNQDGDVILEIASDPGFTTNVQTLSITQNAQAISLAVVLNSVQTQTGVLSGFVPAGYYARLRTVNNTGTPTFTYRVGQEVLM
jgi:hypothetical protein